MRQVMNFVKANIGEFGFRTLISLILLAVGLVFVVFAIKKIPSLGRGFFLVGLTAVSLLLVWQIEIAEEKIHLFEFAVLGWLAFKDTWSKDKKSKGVILALVFTFAVGVLDEGFQAVLPYRYFQGWDIFLNCLGGLWGVLSFLIFRGAR
ncbi:MAG: VanZ family protein [Candidatus Omnitrophica bacterium]|nr:VanZ family protein [Candidatus Omnitrophota bacterium]